MDHDEHYDIHNLNGERAACFGHPDGTRPDGREHLLGRPYPESEGGWAESRHRRWRCTQFDALGALPPLASRVEP